MVHALQSYSIVGTGNSQRAKLAEILLWRGAEQSELIGCRNAAGEDKTKRSRRGGSRLDAHVLLWSEIPSASPSWQGSGHWLEDGKAEDGAEEGCTEGPAGL